MSRAAARACRAAAAVSLAALLASPAVSGDEPLPAQPAPVTDARTALRRLADTGDYAGLLEAADRVLDGDRTSPTGLEYRAYALHRLRRLPDALDGYRDLVRQVPDHAWGWAQLGGVATEVGLLDVAEDALERAVDLAPSSQDAWAKLVRVLRSRSDYGSALDALAKARAKGVDAGWCELESASVAWAAGDTAGADERVERAAELGADPAVVANVRRLVAFDRVLTDEERRRRREGRAWTFPAGPFTVETRVASHLPPDLGAALRRASELVPDFVGLAPGEGADYRLMLARTLEEHEVHRRRAFSRGPVGSAFTERSAPGRRAVAVIYAAWSQDGIERTVAHEAAHVFVGVRCAGVPVWLDEGLATYLEGWVLGDDRSALRKDLLASLRGGGARTGPRLPWPVLVRDATAFQGPAARVRYAQAWLVVHWMLHGEGGPGDAGVRRLLDAHRGEGADPWTALLGVCGDDAGARIDAHLAKLLSASAPPTARPAPPR